MVTRLCWLSDTSGCCVVRVQKTAGRQLCSLPADKWSYLLDQVGKHVDLQSILNQVRLVNKFQFFTFCLSIIHSFAVSCCFFVDLMLVRHVLEISAENLYQKAGSINQQENRALFYSLPETCTGKIRYQIAWETRQKLVPVFSHWFLAQISGKYVVHKKQWIVA